MGQQSNHRFVAITNNWPSIDIGAMRHAVTIQSYGASSPPAVNASGVVFQWNAFVSAMAAIDTARGTDVIRGGQTTSQVSLFVAIWYQAGITGGMRVVTDNGSTYTIQSVDNVLEMNVVLVLGCIALGTND